MPKRSLWRLQRRHPHRVVTLWRPHGHRLPGVHGHGHGHGHRHGHSLAGAPRHRASAAAPRRRRHHPLGQRAPAEAQRRRGRRRATPWLPRGRALLQQRQQRRPVARSVGHPGPAVTGCRWPSSPHRRPTLPVPQRAPMPQSPSTALERQGRGLGMGGGGGSAGDVWGWGGLEGRERGSARAGALRSRARAPRIGGGGAREGTSRTCEAMPPRPPPLPASWSNPWAASRHPPPYLSQARDTYGGGGSFS